MQEVEDIINESLTFCFVLFVLFSAIVIRLDGSQVAVEVHVPGHSSQVFDIYAGS
jgi:exosortase/archaeosortase